MTFRPRLAPRPPDKPDLPPGQHLVAELPVVTAEPSPPIAVPDWTFTLTSEIGEQRTWDWAALTALPVETCVVDLHSVLGWSVMDTSWQGVPMRELFAGLRFSAEYARVSTHTDYSVTLPVEDLLEMPTWIAVGFRDGPIPTGHGGPARLLVPHLYLYQSAKWIRAIQLTDDTGEPYPRGLHRYGDPWREQRYREPHHRNDHPTERQFP